MRRNRGITLIALVITIIVLLILAAVSIQAITGDNGIAPKARTAKEQSEIGTEKEQIKLSYSSCKLDVVYDLDASISASHLEDKMNESYGEGTVEVTGDRLLTVFYTETEREYLVLANGTVLDKDETLKNLTYENSVGIAEDGSLVDMLLWEYDYDIDTNSYLIGCEPYSGFSKSQVYKGEFIDGKIQGEIPAYIFDLRYDENFLPVTSLSCAFSGREELIYPPKIPNTVINLRGTFLGTSIIEPPIISNGVEIMRSTFSDCAYLKEAPIIPNTVKNMERTFSKCVSLVKAPEIPNGVTDLSYVFEDCINLIEAPVIPNTVTNMNGSFCGCISLRKASTIPQSVTNISSVFAKCNSLTGNLIINANLSASYYNYNNALYNAAINEDCELILKGSSTMLEEILETKSINSNIRIGN